MATFIDLLLGPAAYEPPASGAVHLVLGGSLAADPGTLLAGGPVRMAWGRVTGVAAAGPVAPWQRSAVSGAGDVRLPWNASGSAVVGAVLAPWDGVGDAVPQLVVAPWNRATGGSHTILAPWQRPESRHRIVRAPWQRATPAGRDARAPWNAAAGGSRVVLAPWQHAGRRVRAVQAPWNRAALLIAPNRPALVRPPAVPPGVLSWVNLHFCRPLESDRLDLVLGVDPCAGVLYDATTRYILSRPVYMQVHTITAVRLPDMEPVPLDSFTFSTDVDAYGWNLTAEGPVSLLSLLAPVAGEPAQLRLTVDGLVFEFLIEGLRRNRSFGQTNAGVTGRSTSVLLGEPYRAKRAWLNTVPMTAQQLAEEALEFTGVGLDWRLTDWLVPAGAWSHTGTPLSALRAIADAVGGTLASPRAGSTIIVAPRYPALPWDWAAATPDVVMALDPVDADSYERADRPAYEGLYISGQQQGVLALVKRTGTGPDLYMPLETDPLITHLDAARQRGEARLGAAGPQARISQTMPVLTGEDEPGVIDVGSLVQVDDPGGAWRGLVRGVSVSGDRVSVRQTLTLERHL